MLAAGVASSVAPSPLARARASKGSVCPHCDAPTELGASLCGYCGITLGEPPRRSGMTQRAMALDAEAARLALAALPPAPVSASIAIPSKPRALTWMERVFVVMTFGLGWLWLRRRRERTLESFSVSES